MLEGVSAGTALMGHKAVSVTVMAGTHKQLTQAEHRPAEKQHMRRKSMHACCFIICLMQAKCRCLVMLKHLFLSRIMHSLHNASCLTSYEAKSIVSVVTSVVSHASSSNKFQYCWNSKWDVQRSCCTFFMYLSRCWSACCCICTRLGYHTGLPLDCRTAQVP